MTFYFVPHLETILVFHWVITDQGFVLAVRLETSLAQLNYFLSNVLCVSFCLCVFMINSEPFRLQNFINYRVVFTAPPS